MEMLASLYNLIFSTSFAFSVIRMSTPIIFAALGAVISRSAGILNLAIEGIMLASALSGVIVSAFTQSAFLGFLAAVLTGVTIAVVLAGSSLQLETDIFLASLAINMIASGGTVFIMFLVCGDKGATTSLKSLVMPDITIPGLEAVPLLGPILSGHNVLTYFAFVSVAAVYILLYKTALGLRIRSVGENPHASESVGLNVKKIKFIAVLLSGLFASFGGAYMSMGYVSWFARDMVAGRGWIGLSAMSLGNDRPVGAFLASLLFGFSDAMSNVLQTVKMPVEFVQMIPYVATILGLILFSEKKKRSKKNQKNGEDA